MASSRRVSIHRRDLSRFRRRGVTASSFMASYHLAEGPQFTGGKAEECIPSLEMQETDA